MSHDLHEMMKEAQCEERYVELARVAREFCKGTVVAVAVTRSTATNLPLRKTNTNTQKVNKKLAVQSMDHSDTVEDGEPEGSAAPMTSALAFLASGGMASHSKGAQRRGAYKTQVHKGPTCGEGGSILNRMRARCHTTDDIESYGNKQSSDDSLLLDNFVTITHAERSTREQGRQGCERPRCGQLGW